MINTFWLLALVSVCAVGVLVLVGLLAAWRKW